MRILFYYFANENVGFGHHYRSIELARIASMAGHKIAIATDMIRDFPYHYFESEPNNPSHLQRAVDNFKPDWVVIDLENESPAWCYQTGCKTLTLDGVGQPSAELGLVVSQGYEGSKYCAPDYVILRKNYYEYDPKAPFDFVFGGATDRMNLLQKYHDAIPENEAFLLITDHADFVNSGSGKNQRARAKNDLAIYSFMAMSKRAVVAMGMTVWELVQMGIPSYVFSCTDRHLESALEMDRRGVIKAYPEVGIPDSETLKEFLNQPFNPIFGSEKPDGNGAMRTVELMENN